MKNRIVGAIIRKRTLFRTSSRLKFFKWTWGLTITRSSLYTFWFLWDLSPCFIKDWYSSLFFIVLFRILTYRNVSIHFPMLFMHTYYPSLHYLSRVFFVFLHYFPIFVFIFSVNCFTTLCFIIDFFISDSYNLFGYSLFSLYFPRF